MFFNVVQNDSQILQINPANKLSNNNNNYDGRYYNTEEITNR